MDFLPLRIIVVIHLNFSVQLGDIYFVITKYFGSGWEIGGLFSLYFAGFLIYLVLFGVFFGGGLTFLSPFSNYILYIFNLFNIYVFI